MADRFEGLSPAKLNLFLHITGRREDGYHELQTVFQLLDWGDRVQVSVCGDNEIRRGREIHAVPVDEDLSIRAAHALQAFSGVTRGAEICIEKNIPQGSGLGGASSNAATVLMALNLLWDCGLDSETLAGIGLKLGADVPLFVAGRSAWAEGVGEQLTPIELGNRWYVLVFPDEGVSTGKVFSDPGLPRHTAPLVRADFAADGNYTGLGNDCLEVVLKRSPGLAEIHASLSGKGDFYLTGTGSTFFLEAKSKNHAIGLTQELKTHYNVRAARGLDRTPVSKALVRASTES